MRVHAPAHSPVSTHLPARRDPAGDPRPAAAYPPVFGVPGDGALSVLEGVLLLIAGGVWESIADVGEVLGLPRNLLWPAGMRAR